MSVVGARVSTVLVEALIDVIARSPTSPTGAGVTMLVVEALTADASQARVSSVLVEALLSDSGGADPEPPGNGGGGGTRIYGWG